MPQLAPGQVLQEVQAFLEPRFVRPPVATDWATWEARSAACAAQYARARSSFAAPRRSGATRNAASSGWTRSTADPVTAFASFATKPCPACGFPGCCICRTFCRVKYPWRSTSTAIRQPVTPPTTNNCAINLAKRGMLSLSLEWFGMGQLRTGGFAHGRLNQLDLCGASGLAPFYLALSRAIDVGLSLEHADKNRVLVTGLSGGGWQTILISSLDERVTLANPVAGYGSFFTNLAFGDMGDSEQAPADMAMVADYTHLTALRAAAYVVDVQRGRRLLLPERAHAGAAIASRRAHLCAIRCARPITLARELRSRHAQLRAGEPRAALRGDWRLFPSRRRNVSPYGDPIERGTEDRPAVAGALAG